jgi:hypothetical protein
MHGLGSGSWEEHPEIPTISAGTIPGAGMAWQGQFSWELKALLCSRPSCDLRSTSPSLSFHCHKRGIVAPVLLWGFYDDEMRPMGG